MFSKPFSKVCHFPLSSMFWSTVVSGHLEPVKPISFSQDKFIFYAVRKVPGFSAAPCRSFASQLVKISWKMHAVRLQNSPPETQIRHSTGLWNLREKPKLTPFFSSRPTRRSMNISKKVPSSPETTMFRLVRQKQKAANMCRPRKWRRNRHKRSSLETVSKVFDLICAYELLMMQPTSGQLHIAGGLHKINFGVIIKNQQRQTWTQLYRSYKYCN